MHKQSSFTVAKILELEEVEEDKTNTEERHIYHPKTRGVPPEKPLEKVKENPSAAITEILAVEFESFLIHKLADGPYFSNLDSRQRPNYKYEQVVRTKLRGNRANDWHGLNAARVSYSEFCTHIGANLPAGPVYS